MKIPEFKASKKFLGDFAVPCLVAKIKNADVPGLATQHLAQFKKNPKLEIWLRLEKPGIKSAWMQTQLEALFAKDGLTAVVAEGLKQLPSDAYDFHVEEGPFLKQHGLAPYVYVECVIIDEVEQRILIQIEDGLDTFIEHCGYIYSEGAEWRFGEIDDFLSYTATLDKHRIDPFAALKGRQKKKLDELFPPPPPDAPVETDCSCIYGRWEIDEAETNELLKQIGEEPFSPGILTGEFHGFHETYIEPRFGGRIEGWERRGNWFTIKGRSLTFWFDGQRLVESVLLDSGYTCRVYRKATEWKYEAFALDKEIPLPGAETARCLAPDDGKLFVARESAVDVVDGLGATKLEYVRIRPALISAPNISSFAAIEFNRICGLSRAEENICLLGHSSGWGVFSSAKTGKTPVAVSLLADINELYVFSAGDCSATVYEITERAKELTLKQTIPLPAQPASAACDKESRLVYCSLEGRDEIAVIDAKTHSVIAVWPVATGKGPFSLAVDYLARRLFVNCADGQLLMLDGENGKVVASIPVGDGAGTCMFDDSKRLLFSIAGNGSLTIARLETAAKLTVVQTLPTEGAPHSIVMQSFSRRLVLLRKGLETGAALLLYGPADAMKPPEVVPKVHSWEKRFPVRSPEDRAVSDLKWLAGDWQFSEGKTKEIFRDLGKSEDELALMKAARVVGQDGYQFLEGKRNLIMLGEVHADATIEKCERTGNHFYLTLSWPDKPSLVEYIWCDGATLVERSGVAYQRAVVQQ